MFGIADLGLRAESRAEGRRVIKKSLHAVRDLGCGARDLT